MKIQVYSERQGILCGNYARFLIRKRWVCALTAGGGYAEYVAVHADHALPIPSGLTVEGIIGDADPPRRSDSREAGR